jgi:uncharacterized protein (DUF1330 family)
MNNHITNIHIKVGLAMIASAAFGAAAVQGLHAQAKPPAFQIAEITVTDQEAYGKEFLPAIAKVVTGGGGKFLARGGQTISVQGTPADPRIVVVQFDSIDKMKALFDSAAFKETIAMGNKYAKQRIFGVEGVQP